MNNILKKGGGELHFSDAEELSPYIQAYMVCTPSPCFTQFCFIAPCQLHHLLSSLIQVREENPILYSHKTQLNIKLSLLQHYNNMFRPKLSAIFRLYRVTDGNRTFFK